MSTNQTYLISGWPSDFVEMYLNLPPEFHDDDHEVHEGTVDSQSLLEDSLLPLKALFDRMQVATYSTAFSGVDTPGTAFAQLRAALGEFLVDRGVVDSVNHPQHLHGIVSGLMFELICFCLCSCLTMLCYVEIDLDRPRPRRTRHRLSFNTVQGME